MIRYGLFKLNTSSILAVQLVKIILIVDVSDPGFVMQCYAVLGALSSFAIILMRKRELVALLQ